MRAIESGESGRGVGVRLMGSGCTGRVMGMRAMGSIESGRGVGVRAHTSAEVSSASVLSPSQQSEQRAQEASACEWVVVRAGGDGDGTSGAAYGVYCVVVCYVVL